MRHFYTGYLGALALASPAVAHSNKLLNDSITLDKSHYTLLNPYTYPHNFDDSQGDQNPLTKTSCTGA